MTKGERQRLPQPRWWEGLDVSGFYDQLHRFEETVYRPEEIDFTHDVYYPLNFPGRYDLVGQAGVVEQTDLGTFGCILLNPAGVKRFREIAVGLVTFRSLGLHLSRPYYTLIGQCFQLRAKASP